MTPIGYAYNGNVYCDSCLDRDGIDYSDKNQADDAPFPYFDTDESDYPLHCGDCHEFLGGNLTRYGFEWLEKCWREDRWRDRILIEQYMRHYDWFDWHFIPTPWGWMDPLGNLRDDV